MAEWKEITKEQFEAKLDVKTDYGTLLDMWREEKNKRQEAEKELALIRAIGNISPEFKKLQQEIESLKKNFQIERETHQADILSKDQEIGRLMKKITLK
jgi:phage host-nuclease inhibitor protein Gam|tara:strand:+ start:479 stop:775 length:297 start_codon:yes stop_codon:yes gene_type:complete